MRVAIVHDWLVTYGGAERVLEQMLSVFPESDLFSVVDFLGKGQRGFIREKAVHTSFVQKLPFAAKNYRSYLPLMPLAVERFDLSSYDLVISSSYAVSKGVLTGPDQLHLCMCHSPMRYAWDLQHQYLKEAGLNSGIKSWIAGWILHEIRLWDYRTANGVDAFIAISQFIARRIWKTYRRESTVIYPPVDVDNFTFVEKKADYYLTVSRMVPYKRIDLIVEAFSHLPDHRLVVVGDGPDFHKIRRKAGKNVELLGYQSFSVLRQYLQNARAFVFAAEEDFGIAPIEAQACGTPVIALARGGALETVRGLDRDRPTAVFFEEQERESLIRAVGLFEANREKIDPQWCRVNALRFSPSRFRAEFTDFVDRQWDLFRAVRIHGKGPKETYGSG